MGKILVTGGAGYIGSHTIVDLIENGYEIISADNFINSTSESYEGIAAITAKEIINYNIDLCELDALEEIFRKHSDITGIIHFAALKAVGESVKNPVLYFRNNIVSLINLCDCAIKYGVRHFIFSSSCTVYGNVETLPVTEDTPWQDAESPYGRTKQISEQILQDCFKHTEISTINLRYFNPAGAHDSILLGESPLNEAQNLVPVITETAIGKREKTVVFGDDYATRDGSCIRDYVHVMDLASAHTKALQYLEMGKNTQKVEVFNLGIGQGVSVLEAIHAFERVSGKDLNYEIGPRRPGDVIAIYADYSKAKKELGWEPLRDIDDIMDTAWKWELKK